MTQSHCYLDGKYCPVESASLPISDIGLVHGAIVTEQLRTLNRKPFLLTQHLARFQNGLRLLDIRLQESLPEIESIVIELSNKYLQDTQAPDCGIGFFATPGSTSRFGQPSHEPRFCAYCYALPTAELKTVYENGCRIEISSTQDVDEQSWPKNVKIRSRLHYYLADLAVRNSGALAMLTDNAGNLRDTSVAAPIFVFEENRITLPPEKDILQSTSLDFAIQLASEIGMAVERRPIHRSELSQIRSMALANSLFCLAKVEKIDDHTLDKDSDEINSLIQAWKDSAGIDFELGM